jgi:hypothetical protein
MANIGKKGGIFHVRFRGKEYKKSLKIRDRIHAEAAKKVTELTIHRVIMGQLSLPTDVDAGNFIFSGGTLNKPPASPAKAIIPPSTKELAAEYCERQKPLMAPSYHYSQAMHLRHFQRFLGSYADAACNQVSFRDLDRYLKKRLGERHANTVERERITLMQFYKWVTQQGYLIQSPAIGLERIKGGEDRPPFRTVGEIKKIVERGGLAADEILKMWDAFI